jgi:hypothetical protein
MLMGGGGIANKTKIIKCRVTPEEYEIIIKKAKKANMNLSRYLSFSALEKDIVVFEDLKKFTHQLSKVGVNLNQIAMLCHQGKITCPDILPVKKVVTEIWQSLTSLTQKTKRTRG